MIKELDRVGVNVRYIIFGEEKNLLFLLAIVPCVPTCPVPPINTVMTKLKKCQTDHVNDIPEYVTTST